MNNDVTEQSVGNSFLFGGDIERDALCFDLFFNEGPFGLVIFDELYRIRKVNSRLEAMLEFPANQMENMTLGTVLDGEDVLRLKSFFLNENVNYNSLIANMSFLRRNWREAHNYTTYVKKFSNQNKETHYCMLLFEQYFGPTGGRIERDQGFYDAVLETQEQERQYIGDLLHDSVAQLLYGIRLNLQYFLKGHPEHRDEISPVKGMLNDAISSIRDLSMDLNVSVLSEFGLQSAIENMASRLAVPDFNIKTDIRGSHHRLTSRCRLTIYRITQELLNNAMKHSHASQVVIRILIRKTKVIIEVQDNGIGFTLDDPHLLIGGSGLRGIMARIKPFQGELEVNRTGDRVCVRVVLILDYLSWRK